MARRQLSSMIEDLRILLLQPPWSHFARLVRMIDSMADSPEMEKLTNDELRSLKSFRITLHRCATMEPDMMLKHVAAHWLGATDQAVRKLSIGPEAVRTVATMMDYAPTGQTTYGMLG